jgi:hypothetical protein
MAKAFDPATKRYWVYSFLDGVIESKHATRAQAKAEARALAARRGGVFCAIYAKPFFRCGSAPAKPLGEVQRPRKRAATARGAK